MFLFSSCVGLFIFKLSFNQMKGIKNEEGKPKNLNSSLLSTTRNQEFFLFKTVTDFIIVTGFH